MSSSLLLAEDLDHIFKYTKDLFKELENKNIFVTGGTGFFGIWIIESFLYLNKKLNLNSKITILTRDKSNFLSKNKHLSKISEIEFVEGDICSFRCENQKYDFLIHAAAQASADLNKNAPLEMIRVIVDGTRNVLDFASRNNVSKLLFVSSGAIYGKLPYTVSHVSEEDNFAPSVNDPLSAYGEAKRLAELLCVIAASQSKNLEVKIARCFAFVGPYLPLNTHFAIGNFIQNSILGEDIIIKGDGSPRRSYLYSSDLIIWLWTILLKGRNAEVYNVGSDESISIGELANLVAKLSNKNQQVIVKGSRATHCSISENYERYVPNVDKAYRELGLKKIVELDEAVLKTLGWQYEANNRFKV